MISKNKRNRIIEEIVQQWAVDQERYIRLELIVAEYFKKYISSTETLPTVTHRVKSLLSLVKTAIKKEKTYANINDKLGFRIICHFKSQLPLIKKFIDDSFDVLKFECKAEGLAYDKVGYVSEHYEVCMKSDIPEFQMHGELHHMIFEIQTRTICQHAWADVEHSLAYKQDADLDNVTKRRIFRLSSLLEVCDDEFDSVNRQLLELPGSRAFALLRMVEGKFYKYARRSYDRDISFHTINTLINALHPKIDFGKLQGQLQEFLDKNESRIQQIFIQNETLLDKDIYLSQPEIILIWYLVEKHPYDLVEIWGSNFDIDDLSDMAITWGKPIPLTE